MKRKITQPTYTTDIHGEINQIDERDVVFAVNDLLRFYGEGSQEFDEYFQSHGDELAYYRSQNKRLALGSTGVVDAPLFSSQFWALHMISKEDFVSGRVAEKKTVLGPVRASEKVKGLGSYLGAGLVGITKLKQEWVYSHVGRTRGGSKGYKKRSTPVDLRGHSHAIAIAVPMNYELNKTAPHFPTLLATAKGYAETAWISIQIAETIRQWGYQARAHHFGNYQVLPVPIAVDAGLGELSRAGYLLSKEYGLGMRLAVVTTDLPLEEDAPIDIGVQSFCEQCQLCAKYCPVNAIPMGRKVEHNGVKKWKLDEKKCYSYWTVNQTDCGICMAVCPWTKPSNAFHKMMAEFATIKGPHQRFMAWADDITTSKSRKAGPEFLDYKPE